MIAILRLTHPFSISPYRIVPAVLLLLSTLLISSLSYAESNTKGLEIAKERKSLDRGWQDSQATVTMILKNAQGDQSIRKMRVSSLEVRDDGDKGLTIFDEPRDVQGTVFLSYSHINDDDEQWLYLPALKRVKRIASRNKSGPFMGSEFSYEDLSSFEVEKYTFHYLNDESIDGHPCFVVEQTPVDKASGYTKQIAWIDQKRYIPIKVEYYDRKQSLLKTLTLRDYNKYMDKYWRANTLEMVNHQTGKSTMLKTENIEFKTGLEDKNFNINMIKRLR
ncbi:outer membrane lipoprotein-sorting protein [Vibrio sp.]|nr:outer membrane lipoprotein-sorting protein [Vibrio sp.]